ncbi:MAG: hypothetical protein M1337_01510 [Actinobacteria bacterium]|nr:hypothetical protein [Actinomycetota bacterium]
MTNVGLVMRSRMIISTGRGWHLLLAVALLVVAVQTVAVTGAHFTAGTRNPGNLFAVGKVDLSNDREGVVIVNAPSLRPGESSAATTLTLTNNGDYTGPVIVAVGGITDTPASAAFSQIVRLVIIDASGGATVYNGPLASLGTLSLTTLAPAQVHAYQFSLTFAAGDGSPSLQGVATSARLTFTLGTT